ncbi:hypothetical protein [Streptomyces sp. NPDC089919]|uniref:hypothetical protein n=1 Tax=Streptomyces sp. NPDC089919 TaxID=3155188 RepID=UPI00344103A2
MKYGDVLIVDELHRLDRVAARLLQLMLDRFLTEEVSFQTPACDGQSEAGRHLAAGRPGMPFFRSTAAATRNDKAWEELQHLLGIADLSGPQARRIAEIWEVLGEDHDAELWWLVAAELGDEDAIDYAEILAEENAERGTNPVKVSGLVCEALRAGDLGIAQFIASGGREIELRDLVRRLQSECIPEEGNHSSVVQPPAPFRNRQDKAAVSSLRDIRGKRGTDESWIGGEGALLASGS